MSHTGVAGSEHRPNGRSAWPGTYAQSAVLLIRQVGCFWLFGTLAATGGKPRLSSTRPRFIPALDSSVRRIASQTDIRLAPNPTGNLHAAFWIEQDLCQRFRFKVPGSRFKVFKCDAWRRGT
jgi:hypothetical protein